MKMIIVGTDHTWLLHHCIYLMEDVVTRMERGQLVQKIGSKEMLQQALTAAVVEAKRRLG